MPRKRNFKCSICNAEKYKKELYTPTYISFETSKETRVRITRTFKPRNPICSNKECYNKWKQSLLKKLNK